MFSMFGRTGAPTKMGPPHEDQKKFLQRANTPKLPAKVIEVINKIKILCYTWNYYCILGALGPHIFF